MHGMKVRLSFVLHQHQRKLRKTTKVSVTTAGTQPDNRILGSRIWSSISTADCQRYTASVQYIIYRQYTTHQYNDI